MAALARSKRKPAPAPARRPGVAAREARRVRSRRLLLAGAVLFSAVILFAWFPASSLLSAHSNLKATQSQLGSLHAQDAALAQEQKNLSDTDEIECSDLAEVNAMLVADKVQNRKDFDVHHRDSHANSAVLQRYFANWLRRLDISETRYGELVARLESDDVGGQARRLMWQ